MAEPARKIDPVYDPENDQPGTRPDLKALEGGGETTPPQRDWYNANNPKSPADPEDLNEAEKNGGDLPKHENTVGDGYKPGGHEPPLRSRIFRGRKRKAAIFGGMAAAIIAAIIAAFLFLIPLKILHIVNNLQARFYATAENAVEKETEKLFSGYVLGKMLAGCKSDIIDQNCNPYNGTTLVTRLYRGWSDGRLEEKLRKQSGLEIKKVGGRYYMRFNPTDQIDLTDLTKNKTISQIIDARGDWTEVKKNQVRGTFKSALETTTRHASTMYYLKVTPYLAKRFGITWCVIGCDKKGRFEAWKGDKKLAAKMYLAKRVLGPRAELYSMIMQCLYSPGACDKDKVIKATEEYEYRATKEGCQKGCDYNNRRTSVVLNDMEKALLAKALDFDSDYKKLRRAFEVFEKSGFITAMFKLWGPDARVDDEGDGKGKAELDGEGEAIEKAEAEGRKQGFKVSPVRTLGWVVMAAYIADFVNELPDMVAKMQYDINSSTMAQVWAMYRTAPDELKEGEIDAEIYGSFVTSLGPGLQPTEGNVPQVGGTAGAESSPLYQAIVSSGPYEAAGVGTSNVAVSKDYVCADGKPPPAKQLICKEEQLTPKGDGGCSQSWFVCELDKIKKIPGWGLIAQASDFLTDTIDGLVGKILGWLGKIPFVGDLLGVIADMVSNLAEWTKLGEVLKALAAWMLGINLHLIDNNNSGARTFNLMAGGADVSGNSFAHNGIGGVALKPEQVAQNLDYYREGQLAEYNQKPFFARVLDTESPYSPASKLALAMPSNTTAVFTNINNSFTTFIKNPFGKIIKNFASIFTLKTQAAGFIPGKDPFGVTQYGYPLDDPIFNEDPDQYWQKYCTDENPYNLTRAWNDFAAEDKNLNPENFQPENYQTSTFAGNVPGNIYGTNGCLLIQTAVGSAGAIFTDDVLSAEELAALAPATGSSGGGGPIDCSNAGDPATWADWSAGNPDKYRDLIAQYAPGRTCTDEQLANSDFKTPANAVPNDGVHQYFASYARVDPNSPVPCEQVENGDRYPGKLCIMVKYRDPPGSGNTEPIPVN